MNLSKIRLYKNYAIISIVSIVCLLFLPFTGSHVGLEFQLPNTLAGWLVFIISKLIIAAVNMLILYCFVDQGKFNVRNDPKFLEAQEILLKLSVKKKESQAVPESPSQHMTKVFGKKGSMLFLTSVLGTLTLTQAVLSFDIVTLLTYLFVILGGLIFGVIQMGEEEYWWTVCYWQYAQFKLTEESL